MIANHRCRVTGSHHPHRQSQHIGVARPAVTKVTKSACALVDEGARITEHLASLDQWVIGECLIEKLDEWFG